MNFRDIMLIKGYLIERGSKSKYFEIVGLEYQVHYPTFPLHKASQCKKRGKSID